MNMNQPSAEHLNNLYPDRTSLDIRNIYPWANQSYYKIDEDNPDSYRTVYLKVNHFITIRFNLYGQIRQLEFHQRE